MTSARECVLLLGFGGPTCFEEVRPFILNVTRGRSVSQERIEAVIEQYRTIGGRSPFRELTEQQAKALETELASQGRNIPVEMGFLYWHPYIHETIAKLVTNQISDVVAIVMAPHRTEASFDRYVKGLEETLKETDVDLRIDFAPTWHKHHRFIEAQTTRVREKLELIPASEYSSTRIIFTAHSVPTYMSDASQYAAQIAESAELVCRQLEWANWGVAYQSRSGSPHQPWLEPDIRDAIAAAKESGIANVVVVPIGFVCDHVEVLFDLDVQASEFAQSLGVKMLRAGTVGSHPSFIKMLAELVQSRVQL